jgi:hypothetical protein
MMIALSFGLNRLTVAELQQLVNCHD